VEPLESLRLLSSVIDFPTPTASADPAGIVAGPDGNLWFAEFTANKIGMINPATHATADFAIPTAGGNPFSITAGADGNLWFTEWTTSKIGMINPTTHATTDYALAPNAEPQQITAGPDGNLWFTEFGAGNAKIGTINPATHAINEYALPANAGPSGITVGPDGKLWFTEAGANKIGTIDPVTHTTADFPILTPNARPLGITMGADGNLWFTENAANKLGAINPSTHAVVETSLPTPSAFPYSITSGPDGNLWFTETGNVVRRIGTINPVTLGIAETPSAGGISTPTGIATGPDGNLWYTAGDTSRLGLLTATLNLVATTEPRAFVTPGNPFGLTVSVTYQTGLVDAGYNGPVTVALASNPGGATLGGTLTVTAKNGVATFTGLSLDKLGKGYRIMAYIDPMTTTLTTLVNVVQPPVIVGEKVLYAGKGRRRHVVGFELDFSKSLDATRAENVANYTLTQSLRRRRALVAQPLSLQAAYNAMSRSVTLMLTGRARFAAGGRLVVSAQSPAGVTDAGGVYLDGGNQGVPGDDGTFVIAPGATAISR
jgi:virginiamycin B lyase